MTTRTYLNLNVQLTRADGGYTMQVNALLPLMGRAGQMGVTSRWR